MYPETSSQTLNSTIMSSPKANREVVDPSGRHHKTNRLCFRKFSHDKQPRQMTERCSVSLRILSSVSGYKLALRIIAVFRLEKSLAQLNAIVLKTLMRTSFDRFEQV